MSKKRKIFLGLLIIFGIYLINDWEDVSASFMKGFNETRNKVQEK